MTKGDPLNIPATSMYRVPAGNTLRNAFSQLDPPRVEGWAYVPATVAEINNYFPEPEAC